MPSLAYKAAASHSWLSGTHPVLSAIAAVRHHYSSTTGAFHRQPGVSEAQQSGLEDCWEPGLRRTNMVQPYLGDTPWGSAASRFLKGGPPMTWAHIRHDDRLNHSSLRQPGASEAQQSGLVDCWEPGLRRTNMVQPYTGDTPWGCAPLRLERAPHSTNQRLTTDTHQPTSHHRHC